MIGTLCYMCITVILSARLTLQASTPASKNYIAAVVEYYPLAKAVNSTHLAIENAKNYIQFIKKASEKDVDIIVFPENGLITGDGNSDRSNKLAHSTYLPNPKEMKVVCDDSSIAEYVKSISCAAKRYSLYIVVNLREKEKCTGEQCAKDGHQIYNTNVVFDRKGAIIAKYRKWNLFDEADLNITPKPELSTFTTDFNVTFGQLICFDILYETPSLKLIQDKKITDIIFSTHWFSELPYLTANQIQSGWSYATNVNLLASGYNNPSTASGGSGIYAGKDAIMSRIWSEKRTNSMIISNVSKVINNNQRIELPNPTSSQIITFTTNEINTINGSESVTQQQIKKDDITPYTTELISKNNNTHNLTLCDRNLCCNFNIYMEHKDDLVKNNVNYYRYRLAVFNGVRSFGAKATGGVQICSIISCTNDDISSCGERFETNSIAVHPTTFKSIVITQSIPINANIFHFPTSLVTTDFQSLNNQDFQFDKIKNSTHYNIKYSLIKEKNDLITFGIYGRNFSSDGSPKTTSSANILSISFYYYVILSFSIILTIRNTELFYNNINV